MEAGKPAIQMRERKCVVYPGCWTKLLLTYLQPDPAGGDDSNTLCWRIKLGTFRYQADSLTTRPPHPSYLLVDQSIDQTSSTDSSKLHNIKNNKNNENNTGYILASLHSRGLFLPVHLSLFVGFHFLPS